MTPPRSTKCCTRISGSTQEFSIWGKERFMRKQYLWVLGGLVSVMMALPTQAATATYSLVRTSTLTNVDDTEGRWQFDGGDVYVGATKVGYYVRKKRVSFGVPASINKAAMEMTVIWGSG